MKKCNTCDIKLPLTDFHKRADGPLGRQSNCKQCTTNGNRALREDNRDEFLSYKKTLSCVSCGNPDHRVLDFHHPNDDKFKGVAALLGQGYSIAMLMTEVAKCEVLCANCHRVEHSED